jgi:hypothetical protein
VVSYYPYFTFYYLDTFGRCARNVFRTPNVLWRLRTCSIRRVRVMKGKTLVLLGITVILSPFIWIFLQVLILEPLGVLDIHVSRVPEGPNSCVKITEEWYRYCWDQRDPL